MIEESFMSDLPLISVIVPAFNASDYIAQCIENVQFQTYKNIQLIVIDDGSVDETLAIANRYDIKIISQPNKGVSSARNRGIDEALGDYIHFLDVDDLINDIFYEKLLEAAIAYDADMVCCSVIQEWQPKNSLIYSYKTQALSVEDKFGLTNAAYLGYCVKYLFKAKFLKNQAFRFDTGVDFFEDLLFTIPAVYLSNKIVTVPDAVYVYKKRSSSASAKIKKLERDQKRKKFQLMQHYKRRLSDQYGIDLLSSTDFKITKFRIMGIPFLKKKTFSSGMVRWYLLNICLLQIKDVD